MSSPSEHILLGIDWGTHSSKWACWTGSSKSFLPKMPLYNSDLLCDGDSIIFSPPDDVGDEQFIVRGLKQRLDVFVRQYPSLCASLPVQRLDETFRYHTRSFLSSYGKT